MIPMHSMDVMNSSACVVVVCAIEAEAKHVRDLLLGLQEAPAVPPGIPHSRGSVGGVEVHVIVGGFFAAPKAEIG